MNLQGTICPQNICRWQSTYRATAGLLLVENKSSGNDGPVALQFVLTSFSLCLWPENTSSTKKRKWISSAELEQLDPEQKRILDKPKTAKKLYTFCDCAPVSLVCTGGVNHHETHKYLSICHFSMAFASASARVRRFHGQFRTRSWHRGNCIIWRSPWSCSCWFLSLTLW